jgi:alpha-mannosidase
MQRDRRGRALFQVDLPPCGYQVYDLRPGPGDSPGHGPTGGPADDPGPVVGDNRSLENDHLRVEFDDRGLLSCIFDKSAQRQVLAPETFGNRFQLHPDYPNFYDAWDIDRFTFDQVIDLDDVTSVELVEQGPLRAAIQVVREFGASRVSQIISLDAGSRLIDFDTEVEWHETNRLLKVAFPVNVRSQRATYEIQYGHVERPTHANTSWDVARFEVCAHKWADLSEPGYGVALLNDCKYGYDITDGVIRLSLLRAPTWPDPVADTGHHHFTYRLFPHGGDLRQAGVVDAGYDLNVPPRAVATSAHPAPASPRHSMLSVDADNVVIEVVKRSDDGQGALVVRLYEAWGQRGPVTVRAPFDIGRAALTDLLERPTADVRTNGAAVRLEMSPFQIVTLRLEPAQE